MNTCTRTHTHCHATHRKGGARSVCRASRAIAVRECRSVSPRTGCGECASQCRNAGRWSRVVASGSQIPTGVQRAAHWPDAAPVSGAPMRPYREPHATPDYALRAMRRSVADRAELRRDRSPADIADAAVSVTGAVKGPLSLSRHTGGTAPGTPRESSTACRVCGGMCAAMLRPGAACPRRGGARR